MRDLLRYLLFPSRAVPLIVAMNLPFQSNPFCSRLVRPGAIAYRFPMGQSVHDILHRLRECRWRGAIVGPHGSGKSTLLRTLLPMLKQDGWQVSLVTLHDRKCWLPHGWRPTGPRGFVVVDGFEQLNLLSRCWLRLFCRARAWGLLVTSHQPTGLPTVYHSATSPELLASLVSDLTRTTGNSVPDETVQATFARAQGNLREAFFDLYDVHEQQSAARRV